MSETSFSTKTDKKVTLKAVFFDSGQTFGLAAQFDNGESYSVAFPSSLNDTEVADKLFELAQWIYKDR